MNNRYYWLGLATGVGLGMLIGSTAVALAVVNQNTTPCADCAEKDKRAAELRADIEAGAPTNGTAKRARAKAGAGAEEV